MNEDKKINHDVLKWIIIGFAGFAVAVSIFSAGMFVGGMKAQFSYRWAENYHKNFAGPRVGFLGDWKKDLSGGDFIEGHGAFGEIIEINVTGFVIKGRNDVEKIIVTTEDTVVKEGKATVEDELQVGDHIVIIGSSNEQGQIEAKIIRIFNGNDIKDPQKPFQFPPIR